MWIVVNVLFLIVLTTAAAGFANGPSCAPNWFDCGNGRCIASIWLCDSDNDCGNMKDEQDCGKLVPTSSCFSSQFSCESDQHCIPDRWHCDGEKDCEDGSDEKHCENNTDCTGFRCRDHHCIPERWRCDGNKDCQDGSDEELCPSDKLCSKGEFLCSSGSCLNQSLVCDGRKDCSDGSDEGSHCGDSCANATCSQKCKNTPSGPECYCEDGYALDAKNNQTCVDVDECLEDGFCSQMCDNAPGSYRCSCLEGYQLIDNRTCQVTGADPLLLFSTLEEIRGMQLRSGRYFLVHKAMVRSAAVDADPTSQRIYWIEISNKSSIYSVKMDGTGFKTILNDGLLVPEDIAVDYLSRNLYVTDSGLGQVIACKMDGTMCTVLHDTNIGQPRSIVLDPSEGFLYWSDWGEKTAGISRSGMDGSQRTTLVSKDIAWPNGIAIDHSTSRLYWADAKRKSIECVSLNGQSRKVILNGTVFHPYSLAVFEDTIYWSDWSTFSLESCNKFTGHKVTLMTRENGRHIMGIHVYHPVLASRVTNPCWSNNCSHMCLISPPHGFSCACPRGFSLSTDSRTCKMDDTFPSLFVSEGSSIFHIHPEAAGSEIVSELPLSIGTAIITRVTYDPSSKLLFVADASISVIHAINMTSGRTSVLVKNHITFPEDLAFDRRSNNLYWVDSGKGTAEVIAVDSLRRMTLVSDLEGPVALALSRTGYMFIASVTKHSITKFDMDGKNPHVLKAAEGHPMSLAHHPSKSLLFWADPRAGTISFLNYSRTSSPRVLVSRLDGVMSVVVSEEYMYWTSKKREVHLRKGNVTHVLVLPGQNKGVVSRKVSYSPGFGTSEKSGCLVSNGGCSYLCLTSPKGRTCLCQAGMVLGSDNATCVAGGCGDEDFKCVRNGRCLPGEFRCDNSRDCDDGSDEIGCGNYCPGDDFKCRNGKCIIKSWFCDHRDDCGDNSDEENCPEATACAKDQVTCGDGECIPSLWRCDGESDCSDGADESNCGVTRCDPESQFRCDNGQCIPISWRCDASNDCFEGSDERNCSVKLRSCTSSEFMCEKDGTCIDASLTCDGRFDCEDNSDEKNCQSSNATCKSGMFHCGQGLCIYDYERCDGHKDCPNHEDEMNCNNTSCREGEVLCPSTRCISRRWICDGDEDCSDGSDEVDCENKTRQVSNRGYGVSASDCDQFFCYMTGECLPWSKVCDGHQDCEDMPDEGGLCSRSCDRGNGGCTHICNKSPVGPKCDCISGYRLLLDEKTCDDIDECQKPGTCSHFCNNTKGGFKCSCAEGYFLHTDHRRCKAEGGPATLVYLLGDQIRGIDLLSHTQRLYISAESADMRGMDYDAAEGTFYFTEGNDGSINSYSSDTRRQIVIATLPDSKPFDLRYDWIAGNLYYTDDLPSIGVCSKDGKFCSTLVQTGSTDVASMDISPTSGQIFWTSWSLRVDRVSGIIERADMDGSRRQVIVSETQWPVAITVDHVLKMIYWTDSRLNVMECADFHGFNRRHVVSSGMYHPYSMAIFEDHVYWSDWGTDSIVRCDKFTGKDCLKLRESRVKAQVLMVVHKAMQPKGSNRCLYSNCPQLCLPTRSSFTCKCTDDFLKQNTNCEFQAHNISKPVASRPTPAATADLELCEKNYCRDGECSVKNGKPVCKCQDPYSGPTCQYENPPPHHPSYNNSWIIIVGSALVIIGVIFIVYLLCKGHREKLQRMSQSVTVKFRSPKSGREEHRLVVDMDDLSACDEFENGFGGEFRQSYKLADDRDQDFRRWSTHDTRTIGDSIAHFFRRLAKRDSSNFCK